MRGIKLIILSALFIAGSWEAMSQVYSTTLSTDKCSHIQSNLSGNQNNNTFKVGTYWTTKGANYKRAFIEFDVSSIPSNAIVYEATLKITHTGATYVVNPWVTKLITSTWTETGVTPSNQPGISSSSSDWSTVYTEVNDTVMLDVKDMVQRMVYGQVDNYGWSIQVSNEAATYTSGTEFYSDENGSDEPRLLVKYYLPVTFSDVIVSHESGAGESDGGVSFSHTALDPSGHTYAWIDDAGASEGSSQTLSDVPYGWYGLEITGSSNGEKAYCGFLVGTHCEEVTISYTTRPEYTANAYIYDRVVSGGIDYRDVNYGNSTNFRSDNRFFSPSWVDIKSYVDFNLWMDDELTINQADLLLQGWSHSNSGNENQSEVNEVTSYWNEDLITWNASPTNNGTADFSVAATTSSTEDETFDMIDLWNDWKLDNNANYGVLFQLQDFDNDVNCSQFYHSPNTTTTTNRPEWTFKISLFHEDEPHWCHPVYAVLKRDLSGVVYKSVNDNLLFSYENEYASSSSYFDYKIYRHTDVLSPDMDGVNDSVTLGFGVNQRVLDVSSLTSDVVYVMEVTNDKGEKRFLRFKKD